MAGKKKQNSREGTKALVVAGKQASTAAARRCEELVDLIARRKQRIAEDFYDIGQALAEIKKKKLYVALGHSTFARLLTARKLMSETTATKLIEVAAAMPRDEALSLGPEKAYALTRLVAATPATDTVTSVLADGVQVRGKKKDVSRLSRREIEAVTKGVRPKKAIAGEQEATAAAKSARAALRARGGKKADVRALHRSDGWWIQVEVPLAEVGALGGR